MQLTQRIGLNLIKEAKTELAFLALADEYPSLYGVRSSRMPLEDMKFSVFHWRQNMLHGSGIFTC